MCLEVYVLSYICSVYPILKADANNSRNVNYYVGNRLCGIKVIHRQLLFDTAQKSSESMFLPYRVFNIPISPYSTFIGVQI